MNFMFLKEKEKFSLRFAFDLPSSCVLTISLFFLLFMSHVTISVRSRPQTYGPFGSGNGGYQQGTGK
jgi:hypothetical protein